MKTNGLFFISHDVYESKGTWLKPQVEKGKGGAPKAAVALFRREAQNVEIPGMAGRPPYLSWNGHPAMI